MRARSIDAPKRLRSTLRREHDALGRAAIGIAPLVWLADAAGERPSEPDTEAVLDEIQRLGYEGAQLDARFGDPAAVRRGLAKRDLRLAEVYVPLPATTDGPSPAAMSVALERLRFLHDAGGEVLCLAIDGFPEREAVAARAESAAVARFTDAAWDALAVLIEDVVAEAAALGHTVVFHPHAGTFVETPAETARLMRLTDAALLCLDVGHEIVSGGDPVTAIRTYGDRVRHVHLKDVDPHVLERLRSDRAVGLPHAVRDGLFTELGAGMLDLDGVVAALAEHDFDGWLMVEQDRSSNPPSESAAIGRRVLAAALRRPDRATVKGAAA